MGRSQITSLHVSACQPLHHHHVSHLITPGHISCLTPHAITHTSHTSHTCLFGGCVASGVDFAARRLGEWLWANSSDAPDLGRSGRVAEALLQVIWWCCAADVFSCACLLRFPAVRPTPAILRLWVGE